MLNSRNLASLWSRGEPFKVLQYSPFLTPTSGTRKLQYLKSVPTQNGNKESLGASDTHPW